MEEVKETAPVEGAEIQNTEEEVQLSIYDVIQTKLGVQIEGEFEDNEDGLVNWVQKYKDYEFQKEQELKKQNNPLLYELENMASQNIDIYSVMKKIVSNLEGKVDYDDSNVLVQRSIVLQDLISKNNGYFTREELEDRVKKFEDEGRLAEIAKGIADKTNQDIENRNKLEIEQAKKIKQQYDNIVNSNLNKIVNYIEQGKIGDMEIPVAERVQLREWIDSQQALEADENGDVYIKQYIRNPEDLQTIFFKYRNGNIADLVKLKAATLKANSIFNKKQGTQVKQEEKQEDTFLKFMRQNTIIK